MHPENPVYSKGAVMSDAWFILIGQVILNPLLNLLNIWYYFRMWTRTSIRKKVETQQAATITQSEAHAAFEDPVWDPSFTYAGIVKDFYTCLFFQPLFPLSGFIGMVGMIFMYWSQKISLLRLSASPASISMDLAENSIYYISISPVIYGVDFSSPR